MNFSPDMSRVDINMPIKDELVDGELKYLLVGKVPDISRSSLRATIIRHREAFDKGAGAPEQEYRNIHNRYIKPIIPVFHVGLVVHEAWMGLQREAIKRRMSPVDILMVQAGWADQIVVKVRKRQGMAIHILRRVGLTVCACRMLRLENQPSSSF